MATISKGNRKANPNQTKNGRVRIGNFSLAKLQELVEKASRPRDKRKYQNRINILIKKRCIMADRSKEM